MSDCKRRRKLYIVYPNCTFITGIREGYLTAEDKHSKPKYRDCTECERYAECTKQYNRHHYNFIDV